MNAVTHQFSDLESAIDDTHTLFERWMSSASSTPTLPDSETLHYARLALHEWLANLVQHADFEDRTPDVTIDLRTNPRHVHCTVTDNSTGFEFDSQLRVQLKNGEPFPERAMGLRIIDACTEEYSYDRTEDGLHRLEFSISTDHLPCLSNLF